MYNVCDLLGLLSFVVETRWATEVKQARAVELAWRVQENICSVLIAFIWTWVPSAVVLVAFTSYTLLAKEPLTVSRAFTAIEVFSQLQGPMAQLPQQIFALLHGGFLVLSRLGSVTGLKFIPSLCLDATDSSFLSGARGRGLGLWYQARGRYP